MTQTHEFTVPFSRPLRGSALASPAEPLPALPPSRWPSLQTPETLPPLQSEVDQRAFEEVLMGLRGAGEQFGAQYECLLAEMRRAAIELAVAVAGRLLLDGARAGE